MRSLLDANVVSELRRLDARSQLQRKAASHGSESCIAAPVWHELKFGYFRLRDAKRKRALERYLEEIVKPNLPILEYDDKAANWYASECARLCAKR